MSNRKNLTGEKKGTFTTLDITQSLNIDENGCFVSSGTILSSGLITAVHVDYTAHQPDVGRAYTPNLERQKQNI